jgi:hypothetical protein
MMNYEWLLHTPVIRRFKTTETVVHEHEEPIVGEDGEPATTIVREEVTTSLVKELPADRVRLLSSSDDRAASCFHIRLWYGRLVGGEFVGAVYDDGIIISGPNYAKLDMNEDGTISEDELLRMSSEILRWDGELRPSLSSLPAEEQA